MDERGNAQDGAASETQSQSGGTGTVFDESVTESVSASDAQSAEVVAGAEVVVGGSRREVPWVPAYPIYRRFRVFNESLSEALDAADRQQVEVLDTPRSRRLRNQRRAAYLLAA